MIQASRKATQEQLLKEGKDPNKAKGMGMFPAEKVAAPDRTRKQKDVYKKSKKNQDFVEVMDHLEEPQFDEEEMQRIGQEMRKRQQMAMDARQMEAEMRAEEEQEVMTNQ